MTNTPNPGDQAVEAVAVTQADRDWLCRELEAWRPDVCKMTGLPRGADVEIFADKLLHRLSAIPTPPDHTDLIVDDGEPSAWAIEAFRQSVEMYASYMGDPDGNDDTETARSEAAKVIERLAADARQAHASPRELLDQIATMMSAHVVNWPNPKRISTAIVLIDKTMAALKDPPKHKFWRAGEPDCPAELKAGNGELHTLRCKVCGEEDVRDNYCRTALELG